jgi:hypothetical protein
MAEERPKRVGRPVRGPECVKHMTIWEKKQKGTAFDWIAEADEDDA